MSELKLRDYQTECIDAVFQAWSDGLKRPAIVLPTGAGKTVVFAHLIKQFREQQALPLRARSFEHGSRVMVLVHRDELADQAISKIKAVAPGLDVGKVKAENNDVRADVMVCSVQTLASRHRRELLLETQRNWGDVGLIITDECHHGSAPTYQKIYEALPDALNLGVTATLARGDGTGLGDVWDEVVYSKSVLWMISKGFLTDVKAHQVLIEGLDMGGVKRSRGDFQAGDLGRALEDQHADEAITRAYLEHAGDRPGVVFTPTVATAEAAAESLNKAGIVTEVISGETPREERQDIFRRFREGSVQVLSNCMVLTEGFDAPWASCAVIARPTQSNPLYIQMVGRVLRPWPGKENALVLDLVGASGSNKLCTLVDLDPTVREIQDDESLAEAVEREAEAAEAAGAPVLPGSVAFEMRSRAIDLFAGSKTAWNLTDGGVMFIECGQKTVFLWPTKDGNWTVMAAQKGDRKWYPHPEHKNLDISMAMAYGEVVAEDLQDFSTAKSAGWRKGKPSRAQIDLAERYRIDITGMTKGEVSAAMGKYFATQKFDGRIGKVWA